MRPLYNLHPKKKAQANEWQSAHRHTHAASPHLSHHAVPGSIDLFAVFSISDQVEVVGKFDRLGDLLQDVDAETFTAALDVDPWLLCLIAAQIDR